MYAIVETGGKQYQVEEGRYVDVELLGEEKDAKIVFDKVVMIVNGKKSKVGQPYVANAKVEGTIPKTDRAKKIMEQDYHLLPQRSNKEKMYYNQARKREARKSTRRVWNLFAELEAQQEGFQKLSFC